MSTLEPKFTTVNPARRGHGNRIHKMILAQTTPEETVTLLAEDAVARAEGRGGL
jgi:hypothetical protein